MFIVDTNRNWTSYAPAKRGGASASAGPGVHFVETRADLEKLSGPTLVELWNACARASPELSLRETARFSTHAVGVSRVWGLVVAARARYEADHPAGERKAAGNGARSPRAITDKRVERASKVYPVRPGTMQEYALALISREGGISVDDFVAEMNAKKRAKYTRSNAWSALVYILHANKGYGIECRDGRFYRLP